MAKGKSVVIDIDHGYDKWKRIMESGGESVKIGLLEGTDEDIVYRRGYIQEFGMPEANIPERPAHGDTFDENFEEYVDQIEDHLQKDPEDWDFEELFDDLGQTHTNRLVEAIDQWHDPPNAPFTIDKKGFDDPLIETMEMIGSIDYEVGESSEDE